MNFVKIDEMCWNDEVVSGTRPQGHEKSLCEMEQQHAFAEGVI